MGIPADPDPPNHPGPPAGETVACPRCGWEHVVLTCAAPGCGRRFIPQPGYSRTLSPFHDPQLEGPQIPSGFREYKAQKSSQCVRCGVEIL